MDRSTHPSKPARLSQLPGYRLKEMIVGGHISIPELVSDSIAAIAERDGDLHAFSVTCPERALAEAEACQKRIHTGGAAMPLLGLPLAVKDYEPVAGLPFACGSRVFSNRIAGQDSLHVARLRAAGAIVIGKTNTPEFTLLGETRNDLGPDTRNPWDRNRTPGGSSGGSAAALAAGMVPLATGSDTAGSITVPAAFCGLVGLKPSHRRIPIWPGSDDWQPFSDVGPMARCIADLALMFAATSGPDPRDPHAAALPPTVRRGISKPRPLRIAWHTTIAGLPVDPACAAAAEDLAGVFADLGHQMRHAVPLLPDPGPVLDLLGAVEEYRARGALLDRAANELMPETLAILQQGCAAEPRAIEAARSARRRIVSIFQTFMADCDIFILPATACPAFPLRQPPPIIGGRPVVPDWPSYAPFNMLANLTGCPVATLPVRLTADGLPVGALAFAKFGQDELLLSALMQAEAALGPFAPSLKSSH